MKMYYHSKGGKKGKFALRENTYRRMWYLIADYRYFKCIQAGMIQAENWRYQCGPAVATEASGINPEPGRVAMDMAAETSAAYKSEGGRSDMEQISRYIKAIEDALEKIPPAYADYIMEHIINRMRYKDMEGVSERTMKLWVQRFIWLVAQNLGEV